MSPTASNILFNSVLIRREFVEGINASVDWIEAHNATKTEMYRPAFEDDDIMVSSGRRRRMSLVDVTFLLPTYRITT